jgi:hypothetical protein
VVDFLLDEHVNRVFETALRNRGHDIRRAKDQFGENTDDDELLRWCSENGRVFITNDKRDFRPLHESTDHAGIFLYHDHTLPDDDPEGLSRTVDEILSQYGIEELDNQLVDLDAWYDWFRTH